MKELDKFKKLISGKLKCDIENIIFYRIITSEKLEVVKNLDYYKVEGGTPQCFCVKVKIDNEEKNISSFKLYEMPHCCAFMISCNVEISPNFRNLGIGTILNLLRIEIGKHLGYTAILCTDIEQNKYQRKILKKNGWKDIYELVNKRTRNKVFLSLIELK